MKFCFINGLLKDILGLVIVEAVFVILMMSVFLNVVVNVGLMVLMLIVVCWV